MRMRRLVNLQATLRDCSPHWGQYVGDIGRRWTHGFRFFAGALRLSPDTLPASSSWPRVCTLLFFFFVGVSPVPFAPLPPNGELTALATPRRDEVYTGAWDRVRVWVYGE